jgi:DNA recombination protein RmuC
MLAMEIAVWIIACIACAVVGFVLSHIWSRSEVANAREQWLRAGVQAAEMEKEASTLRAQLLELAQRSAQYEERARILGDAKQALENSFRSLSAEALKNNNAAFMDLAKASLGEFQQVAKGDLEKRQQAIDSLVAPVKESLEKVDQKIHALERVREQAYGEIRQQFSQMADAQVQLRQETANLVKALRQPHVRGRWGEVQLRRVVEMAGMQNHCDFSEQETLFDDEGKMLRPDLVVRLPGGRTIVIDAKTPISAYLDAHEASDEEVRRQKIREHAMLVRSHLQALSRKSYWEQFPATPECVVMFIPGEAFCSAALEADPDLLDNAFGQNVIIASPASLMALLKAAAFGWRQESIAENARAISQLGQELHKRIGDVASRIEKLGRALESATGAYNEAIGSFESRLSVSARRFKELGATSQDAQIVELRAIEGGVRRLQASSETE